MDRTRMPLVTVLAVALLFSGLLALRFGRTPGDYIFVVIWTFVPFLLLLVPQADVHWRQRVIGKWIALITGTVAGIVMTVLAWGPFYQEMVGFPMIGPFVALGCSGAAILVGYLAGCLIEWWLGRKRRQGEGCCGGCGYPIDGFAKCPECGMESS